MSNGGERIAEVLKRRGVRFLFTLCGGHISPILTEAKKVGVRVIDVRDEANAVFAADATARLSGTPGVAAVTAGPGLTNTITALKNAQMAQSPLVLLGGAAATMLKGRGSLQDIDQLSLVKSCVKWAVPVRYVKDLSTIVDRAFDVAAAGVPGPVFIECPIDLLYEEEEVRKLYLSVGSGTGKQTLQKRATQWYIERHLERLFEAEGGVVPRSPSRVPSPPMAPLVARARYWLRNAKKPLLVVGSQALTPVDRVAEVAAAVRGLGIPVYLTSGARGLLGPSDPLQMRHKRKAALRAADVVVLAGVPTDFRMEYGRSIGRRAKLISANLSMSQLFKNRIPNLPVPAAPSEFLIRLAAAAGDVQVPHEWMDELRARDQERDHEIAALGDAAAGASSADREASAGTAYLNPLKVCRAIDAAMADDAVIVGDGGDFVATASYVLHPRGPLKWLDPGPYGTLGVGAGFAMAAKLVQADAEVWIIYGDGAAGFSLVEFDSMVRHGLPVIAVVGNDAGWTQIARDQVVLLEDDVGTVLARTRYDRVAEGFGGVGLQVTTEEELALALREAKRHAAEGRPVLINVQIGVTEFRKGSISM